MLAKLLKKWRKPGNADDQADALGSFCFVGTYHKAGTVWMGDVFMGIASALGVSYRAIEPDDAALTAPVPAILMQQHSQWPKWASELDGKGMRIIRDPRDIVISAARYHARADEAWLHQPFGFKLSDGTRVAADDPPQPSYAALINGFDSDQERFRFEMQHASRDAINKMTYQDTQPWVRPFIERAFITVRYEDLIDDPAGDRFLDVVDFLGLDREIALAVYRDKHLGNMDEGRIKGRSHISSGQSAQWQSKYDAETAKAFHDRYQFALEALGYEMNSDWVRQF